MALPNVELRIEPIASGSILYLPLAPKTVSDQPAALLSLLARIKNNGPGSIHLSAVKLSFQIADGAPPAADVTIPADVTIGAGQTEYWLNRRDSGINDSVLLPSPPPIAVAVTLSFDGFDGVVTSAPLSAHANPVAAQAYLFPGRPQDLRPGEYWTGASHTHGTGAWGSQLFGYDMGVIGWDKTKSQWTETLEGLDGSKNENYRIHGKPIYAMADGTVVHSLDTVPENPDPPAVLPGVLANWWVDHQGAGNHFYIQHGDEVVLYAHMQPGTLPPDLLPVGSPVKAGAKLGLAGNSGTSSNPHLHIHTIMGNEAEDTPSDDDGFLRPLLFDAFETVDRNELDPETGDGPWVIARDKGLPANGPNAIFPGIRFRRPRLPEYRTIDPLALLLPHHVYVRLTLPDPPPPEVLRARIARVLTGMSPEERRRVERRVDALRRYVDAVEWAVGRR